MSDTTTKCEELRELLIVHGFGSLHEFLDMRDKVNKTSAEIKLKMLREELENEETRISDVDAEGPLMPL